MVACSRLSLYSKPRDLQRALACASGAHGALLCKGWGVTASQLGLPSLTPLSVAGCGQLQLDAAHWAISVALLQVVDNLPNKIVVVDSAMEGSWPK